MNSSRKAWCVNYIGKGKMAYRKAIAVKYKNDEILPYGVVYFAKHNRKDGYYITDSLNKHPVYISSRELSLTPL